MDKHTPGPWSAAPEGNEREWGVDAGKWGIAICADAPGKGSAEANARLIAAAPELLESCMRLIGSLGVMIGDPDNDGDIVFARAAIAKAQGG